MSHLDLWFVSARTEHTTTRPYAGSAMDLLMSGRQGALAWFAICLESEPGHERGPGTGGLADWRTGS